MNTQEKIKQQVTENAIVLYIKGTPVFPQCGFSSKVVGLLNACLEEAGVAKQPVLYINVLEDPDIREGIKQYSQWPTIPQLYLQGEFVGGCDIMTELFQNGELQQRIARVVNA